MTESPPVYMTPVILGIWGWYLLLLRRVKNPSAVVAASHHLRAAPARKKALPTYQRSSCKRRLKHTIARSARGTPRGGMILWDRPRERVSARPYAPSQHRADPTRLARVSTFPL